ncbi:MAG TPA: ATPase domain-containing protein [Anaeromyxobacteraceae bacterium]|jgi:circadian clock protein KaiC|nr:ATPase domain-containing protein [Anaeromyxobacteraceae bacterium]
MTDERLPSGVPGLDHILGGGLVPNALYLVKGAPGTGKTTIGLQFLMEGARRGERCLYLGLSETRGQIGTIARSFGWNIEGIEIHDMRRGGESSERPSSYTVFSPSEVELEEIAREVMEQVERVNPARLVLDSLSEIRLVSEHPFRYRRELLTLSDWITERACTGLLLDVEAEGDAGVVAETLTSGVLELEQLSPEYGGERRRIQVRKLRAAASIGGYHDMCVGEGGVEVFPRLVAATDRARHSSAVVQTGVPALDALLGGGIDRGTSTLLMGPAGTGKSTIAAQIAVAAASRGDRGIILCFDESPTNLLIRGSALGMPLQKHVDAGMIELVPVDPAELTPGQIAHRLRRGGEDGYRVVVIDSLNGYLSAMPEERFLAAHLHELLASLAEKGVASVLTLAQHGFFGGAEAPVNISYVADTVLLFRHFEAAGEVKQALSVVKKRTGPHERTIREAEARAGRRAPGRAADDLPGGALRESGAAARPAFARRA